MELLRRLPHMEDTSPESWSRRKQVQDSLSDLFSLHGYEAVETPLLEPTELFVRKFGGELAGQMYSFTEPGGIPVSLRPEFTSSIMRYVLELVDSEALKSWPVRIHYNGPVFRYDQTAQTLQSTQLGAELLGATGIRPDTEILRLAMLTLQHVKLPAYKLIINDTSILSNLLSQLELPKESHGIILGSVNQLKKGADGLERFKQAVGHIGLLGPTDTALFGTKKFDEKIISDLLEEQVKYTNGIIPGQRTSSEIIHRIATKQNGVENPKLFDQAINLVYEIVNITGTAKSAYNKANEIITSHGMNPLCLDYIMQLVSVLNQCDPSIKIHVDFGLGDSMGYYTGLIFDLRDEKLNLSLGSGGRYDSLASTLTGTSDSFGACGFAYNVEHLITSLSNSNTIDKDERRDSALICATTDRAYVQALKLADKLRDRGITTEIDNFGHSLQQTTSYAQIKNINKVIQVEEDGNTTTHDIS